MAEGKILPFTRQLSGTHTCGYDAVDAFTGNIVTQQEEHIRQLEVRYHRLARGLNEKISAIDARIVRLAYDARLPRREWHQAGAALHLPFMPKWAAVLLLLATLPGEIILAVSMFRALDLMDWETILSGVAVFGASVLVSYGIVSGLRWLPRLTKEESGVKRTHIAVLSVAVIACLMLLLGMVGVRTAFSSAEAASGGLQLGWKAQGGLACVQGFLLFAQMISLYFLGDHHPGAERAHRAWLRARSSIEQLLERRAHLASEMNLLTNTFLAEREAKISYGWRIVTDYRRTLARLGRSDLLDGFDPRLNPAWFAPVRVWPLLNAPPGFVQELFHAPQLEG